MQPICYTKHRLGAICQKYGASEVRSSLDHCPVSLCHSFSLFPLFPFFPFSLSPSPHNLLSLPISLPRMRCEAHCTYSGLRTSLDKQFFCKRCLGAASRPEHNFRPNRHHFLFLLPFDADAFKMCKN